MRALRMGAHLRRPDYSLPMTSVIRRALGALLPCCAFALALASLWGTSARGDIGVVLSEALDESVGKVTRAGHSAVYFSRVCPETPVKLRPCRPDEMGSIISNYTTLGEDQPFEWNDVPLSVFLYGVDDPQFRPLIGLPQIKRALEENYRTEHLAGYCASEFCRTSNKPEWREMVGATLERSLYIFVVHTSLDQDLAFIKQFNSSPNVNHFNGVTRNCATFVRAVVDFYYPHSAHADYLNDFLMTSPKAIARSFTRFGLRHAELDLRVLHFAQLPGTIKRSSQARSGTEQFCRTKKFYPPMVWFAPYGMPAAAGAYYLTGRFNPERELEKHPAVVLAASGRNTGRAGIRANQADGDEPAKTTREQAVGTPAEWKQYQTDFDGILGEAVAEKLIPGRDYIDHFAAQLQNTGTPVLGPHGGMWLEISEGGQTTRLGVSANNVFSSSSNSHLAYSLLLASAHQMLKSPKDRRESMDEFKADWQALQRGRTRVWESLAESHTTQPARQAMLVSARP